MGLPIIINNSIMPLNSAKPALSLSVPVKQLPFSPLLPEARKFKPIDFFQNHPKLQSNFNINMDKYFDRPLFTSYEFTKNAIIQKAKLRKNTNDKPFDTQEHLEMLEKYISVKDCQKFIKYGLFDIRNKEGDYKYTIPEILGINSLKEPIFEIFKQRILSPKPIDIIGMLELNIIEDLKPETLHIEGVDDKDIEVKRNELKVWKQCMYNTIRSLIKLKRSDGEYVITSHFYKFFMFFNSLLYQAKKTDIKLAKDILERITHDADYDFEIDLYNPKKVAATYIQNMKTRNLFLEKSPNGEYNYQPEEIKTVAQYSAEDFAKFKYLEEYDFNGDKWFEPLSPYITVELVKLSPDNIDFLQKNGIIEDFRQNKICQNTFRDLCNTLNNQKLFSNTIFGDMARKDSSVFEFDKSISKEDVLKSTRQADVVKIGDEMYINDRNTLIPYKISKEKFDELFPLIDKYATAQGESGDCYLVATLIALMNNPLTRPYIYSSFEETKDGILCTIKSYKDYNGTTFFKDGKAEPEERSLYGAKAMQMFEKAYAKAALRKNADNVSDNWNNILKRIESGYPSDALSEILGLDFTRVLSEKEFKRLKFFDNNDLKHSALIVNFNNQKLIKEYLSKYGNDKNVINIISWSNVYDLPKQNKLYDRPTLYSNHCYVIDSYNQDRGTINVISAWQGATVFEIPIKKLKNVQFSIGNIEQKK